LRKKQKEKLKEKARRHYVNKIKERVISGWKEYLIRKYQRREELVKADIFGYRKVCNRALNAWLVHYKIALIKRQMKTLSKDFLIRHLCSKPWNIWKERTVYKLEKHEKSFKAQTNLKENLLVKAFAVIKDETRRHRLKRENNRKAEYLANSLLLRKCIRELLRLSQENMQINIRINTLGKALYDIIGSFTRRTVITRLLHWINHTRRYKALEDKIEVMEKIARKQLILNGLYEMRSYGNERAEEAMEVIKSLAKMKVLKARRILKSWFKLITQRVYLRANLTNYITTHDTNTIQSIFYEWRTLTTMVKCLHTTGKEVAKVVNERLIKEYWDIWKIRYIQSIEEQEKYSKAIQYYNETVIVKAFALFKFHCKGKKVVKEEKLKAELFNNLMLMRKVLISLERYREEKGKSKVRMFELSRKIVQIKDYNLKEMMFHGLYAWYIYKKRIKTGYKILSHKLNSNIVKRFFFTWANLTHNKLKEQNSINIKTAKGLYRTNMMKKAFRGMIEFGLTKIRKLNREKLHEVFTAWKILTKGQVMLKKYIKQSNIDEKYTITPINSYRFDLPRLKSVPENDMISPESVSDALSSEFNSVKRFND